MALNTRVSRLAALASFGGLALTIACSSDSAGPGLPSCGAPGTQLTLAVAQYALTNSVTDSGCVTFAANTSADTVEYLVLPWSAGGDITNSVPSASFVLQSASPLAAAIAAARVPYIRAPQTRGATAAGFDHFLRELGRNRRYHVTAAMSRAVPSQPGGSVPAAPPVVGDKRNFKVCANNTCDSTVNVGAVAKSVGQHIAIYVDTLAPAPGLPQSDLDSLGNVFDTQLYPLDTLTFGHVSDIDANSVVIVLMTNQVNKLVSASTCASSGFIAGFFFPGDLAPGFSQSYNNGEIFYSIVADPNATLSCQHTNDDVNFFTPVTFTHEFQHMINFVEHVLVRHASISEDGWLDEGLSKYAEEIAGRSFGDNAHFSQFAIGDVLDAQAYLQAPGATPLLIPADTGTLAMVGASWLFTRYIVDQFGDSLPGKLVQTTLVGANNVATQTGQPFDQTVSRWGFANWVSDLPGLSVPPELQYTSWHFRTTYGNLHTTRPDLVPLPYPLVPAVAGANSVNVSGKLWAGSGVYVRVMQPPNSGAFTLQLSGPGDAPISASVAPHLNVLRIR